MAWLAGWKYRKRITVQADQVDADLSNAPVYVALATGFGSKAKADGTDVRFTDADGTTLLDFQTLLYDDDGASKWFVSVPSIDADDGATFYCYYGKSDAGDGQDASGLWIASGAVGRWGCHDNAASSAVADSRGLYAGVAMDGASPQNTSLLSTAGKLYQGFLLDGTADWGNLGNHAAFELPSYSLAMWLNPTSLANEMRLLCKGAPNTNGFEVQFASNRLYLLHWPATGAYYRYSSTSPLTAGVWQHVVIAYDAVTTDSYFLVNGVSFGGWAGLKNVSYAGADKTIYLGKRGGGGTPNYYPGKVEDARIYNRALSLAEAKFLYHNMNAADNELSWGSEEAARGSVFRSPVFHSLALSG